MSEAKFTKGEWVADIRGGCCAVYEKSRENDTPGMHFDDDRNIYYSSQGAKYTNRRWEMSQEAIANAHLIAAAPEMYEFLENMKSYLNECCSEAKNKRLIVEATEKLLARARGEHV